MKIDQGPIILFRKDRSTEDELFIARKFFDASESRVGLTDRLVIARYSALPFYRELERDLHLQNSRLINSYAEHSYIANFDYYNDIEHLTPKTWFDLKDVPKDDRPLVIKGRTNSRKFDWDTLMLAKTFRDAVRISGELMKDPVISQQGLIYREFIPLKILEIGISGTPFANEWRLFFYKGQLLSYGFYWSISQFRGNFHQSGLDLARAAADIIKERANFFVVDVAEDINGKWWVVEINDGQQSGLSENSPEILYSALRAELGRRR